MEVILNGQSRADTVHTVRFQVSAGPLVDVEPLNERLDGTECLTAVDMWFAFLEHYNLKGVYGTESFLDAILDQHAHELAEEIREETQRLRDDGVLESDRFRPCRDAADQIDPLVSPDGVVRGED